MSRLSSLVVSGLVLGFIVGWLVNRVPSNRIGSNHVVAVYGVPDENGTPTVQPDPLPIDRTDAVSWIGSSPRKNVRIGFKKEVFEGMKYDNQSGLWLIQCRKRQCDSGKVKAPKGSYEYVQFLDDQAKDGWIIITH